ncbi:MAG: chitobiase/beta-hexosaminidase C-terminal domain-containing protein [Prevotella sp.]|nr:chitobiase/beta-hexosaminidase C-terminal domain-containing protein [Prevotella sp.]
MIKKLRYLFTLLFLVIASVTWAEGDEVYKTALFGTNYNSQGVSSYTATWTATNGGFTVSLTNFNNNNNGWSFVKCGRKNNASVATITTSEPIDKAITKVVVTIDAITASNVNSIKLYTSSDNSTWTEAGSFSKATGAQTVSLASPTEDLYYKIEFDCASGSSNGLVTVSKVEYYYNPSGSVAPSISADDVSIAYDATSGEIEYTINNGVDGGALSATTDAEWLTIGTIGTTIPFTCEANEGAERTATVTLTYTYNTSETVTKEVLVTQDLNPNGPGSQANPYTVTQARAAIDAGTGIENVYATGIVSQVDSYSSSYNSITYWISEDGTTTDQLEVYSGKGLNNTNFTSINDVVVGATVVVYGTLKKFNTTYEFDKNNYLVSYTAPAVAVESPTFSPVAGTYAEAQSVTISCETSGAKIYYTVDGSDPTANSTEYTAAINVSTTTTIKAIAIAGNESSAIATATYHINSQASPYTVAQALAFNEYPANGIYVHGIVSTAPTQAPTTSGQLTYYISDNGEATNQLEVYKGKGLNNAAFEAQGDLQVGDIVTVYGNVKIYQETKEFDTGNYLVSFERPQGTPSITVAETEISVPATGGEGTVEVTYINIDESDIQTLDAAGAQATYDWLTVELNNDGNIVYSVDANTGAERVAYLQVYGLGSDESEVVSDVITITQAAYVAPVEGDKYVKVTSTADLTDGEYLIVFEEDNLAFDGSLETLDAVGNTISVTIANNEIAANATIDAATFTIETIEGGYSIKSASGLYIGNISDANALKADAETQYVNAITIGEENNADIVSAGSYLRYNAASNQTRFRYYKSGSYTNQKAIQLYKKVAEIPAETVKVSIAAAATDGTNFYGTMYYSDKNLVVPQGAVAETYAVVGGELKVSTSYAAGDIVPAGTAVVVKTEAAGSFEFAVTSENGKGDSGSMLKGTDEAQTISGEGYKYYMLSLNASRDANSVGFYFDQNSNGGTQVRNGAHKAYLAVPVTAQTQNIMGFPFGGDATGIEGLNVNDNVNANEVYDLQGRRMNVNNMPKGIYIVNGKKVVIK